MHDEIMNRALLPDPHRRLSRNGPRTDPQAAGFTTNLAAAFGGHPRKAGDSTWQIQGTDAQSTSRAYADGRAETAGRGRMVWRYFGNFTSFY
jgi:hypothetical protein